MARHVAVSRDPASGKVANCASKAIASNNSQPKQLYPVLVTGVGDQAAGFDATPAEIIQSHNVKHHAAYRGKVSGVVVSGTRRSNRTNVPTR